MQDGLDKALESLLQMLNIQWTAECRAAACQAPGKNLFEIFFFEMI